MTQMTITEGLAELKTIDKRLTKKADFILNNVYRQECFKDPMASEGGQHKAVAEERQAMKDLEDRKVAIRRAISKANDETTVTIGKESRSINEWLTWRRDVAPKKKELLAKISAKLNQVRAEAQKQGAQVVAAGEAKTQKDIAVNLSEKELAGDIEHIETVLGTLDGQLSLKNATVTILV